jgi:transcriptional regulator with XRE-family HTH domain
MTTSCRLVDRVAENLRGFLAASSLTHERAARRAGVAPRTLANVLRLRARDCLVTTLDRLCSAFDRPGYCVFMPPQMATQPFEIPSVSSCEAVRHNLRRWLVTGEPRSVVSAAYGSGVNQSTLFRINAGQTRIRVSTLERLSAPELMDRPAWRIAAPPDGGVLQRPPAPDTACGGAGVQTTWVTPRSIDRQLRAEPRV